MNTYKITNITDLTAKRDRKHNTTINIEYIDKMHRKTITVKPKATIYLSVSSLPLSVHRLRIKNLINVIEVDATEIPKTQKIEKTTKPKIEPPKTISKAEPEPPKTISKAKSKSTKKVDNVETEK